MVLKFSWFRRNSKKPKALKTSLEQNLFRRSLSTLGQRNASSCFCDLEVTLKKSYMCDDQVSSRTRTDSYLSRAGSQATLLIDMLVVDVGWRWVAWGFGERPGTRCPGYCPVARLCCIPGLHPGQLRSAAHPKTSFDPNAKPGTEKFLLFVLCLFVFLKL